MGLDTISIPSSVTSINSYAFYNNNLDDLSIIPSSVTTLGVFAFANNKFSGKLELSDNITSLKTGVFANNDFTEVVIGEKVNAMEAGAFYGNANLAKITLLSNDLPLYEANNCLVHNESNMIFAGTINSTFDNPKFKGIGARAFAGLNLEGNIVLPNNITTIEEYAFNGCKNITSVKFGSVTMRQAAFAYCDSLKSVEGCIESSVDNANGAFYLCKNLEYARAYGNKIYNQQYAGCAKLKYCINNAKSIGNKAFYGCESLENFYFSNQISSIGDDAFYGTGLKKVYIPDYFDETGYVSIGPGAFCYCKNLTEINLPRNVKFNGSSVFNHTNENLEVKYRGRFDEYTDFANKSGFDLKNPNNIIVLAEEENYRDDYLLSVYDSEIVNKVENIAYFDITTCGIILNNEILGYFDDSDISQGLISFKNYEYKRNGNTQYIKVNNNYYEVKYFGIGYKDGYLHFEQSQFKN